LLGVPYFLLKTMPARQEQLSRRTLLKAAVAGAALKAVEGPLRAFAQEADPVKNRKISEAQKNEWFHPMTEDGKVWSYGVVLRDPALQGAGIQNQGYGSIALTGAGDVGVDVTTNDKYLGDYRGNGARAAMWLQTGPKDQVYLMDVNNQPVALVAADEKGFAGILMPDASTQFGLRVRRTSGAADAVKVNFGNLSKEDAGKPRHPSVIDASEKLAAQAQPAAPVAEAPAPAPVVEQPAPQAPAPVEQPAPQPAAQPERSATVIDFLPTKQVKKWQDAEGAGFFRPLSANGEGYSPFTEFAVIGVPHNQDGSPKYAFRDRGNVGEFFALVRGAGQVRLDVKTHGPFANHIQQGQAAPAFWLSDMQPQTRIRLSDIGGNVLAEAVSDDAGFGGIQLPATDAQFIITLDIPHPESPVDIRIQEGPANQDALNKPSTLKLNGVDSARLKPGA
jgi:hypothetical protein